MILNSPVTLAANPLSNSCPKDRATLVSQLLKDLPGYTNRVIQRSKKFKDSQPLYIVLAGKAEFEPLPTNNHQQYQALFPDTAEQVFFTTLERQYSENRVVTIQSYHWLFLTPTEGGWRMVMLFSRLGSIEGNTPYPPREANNSMVGQAIKLWLRDCAFTQS
jgi:hypothetical protein